MSLELNRRSFLRGLGGFGVALPALEIMGRSSSARAQAAAIPKRYVVAYGGTSTGGLEGTDLVTPSKLGPGYDLPYGLKPIGELAVQDEISVITGLKLPWDTGAGVPAGGRPVQYHGATAVPQLCGVRLTTRDGGAEGPTSDQIAADAIGGDTPHRLLAYRVQPINYAGGSGGGNRGRMSWRGPGMPEDPIASPRLAYQSLFSGFTPPDPKDAAAAQFELRRRKSVLDLVRASTEALVPKLGRADQLRLERHLAEVRSLELRLDQIGDLAGGGCQLPKSPGDDPPIGNSHTVTDNQLHYTPNAGYSNEELRAETLTDMVVMAFTCDASRVCALMYSMTQCFMSMFPLYGHESDMHELGHGAGSLQDMTDGIAWHVKHFARLVAKLRDAKEVDGSSLLEHSALTLLFEGGHGYDPETNDANDAHSTENMIALSAGRAGGLKQGQHIVAPGKHPSQVVLTALNAVGVPGGLGEVTGAIPELAG